MSRIKSSKTTPEIKIRPLMKAFGFSYQPKGIYGKPDFANKNRRIVVFVDGCFWHKCNKHYRRPKSNRMYWDHKIKKNVERDKEVNANLRSSGWRVIRIWEHSIKKLGVVRNKLGGKSNLRKVIK